MKEQQEAEALIKKQFPNLAPYLFGNKMIGYTTEQFAEIKSLEQKKLEALEKQISTNQANIDKIIEKLTPKQESVPSSPVSDAAKSKYESEVVTPAKWFGGIKTNETKDAFLSWSLNKEEFLQSHKFRRRHSAGANYTKTEAVTLNAADIPEIFDKEVFVLPGGRQRVNIRPYVKFKSIPNGADTVNWYKIDSFDVDDTTAEGSEPTNVSQTVTKVQAVPTLYREVQTIGYSQIENAPFGLIEAVNEAAMLGSIAVENNAVLNTAADAATPGLWINGNTGATIASDDVSGMTLTETAIQVGLQHLENQGYDTSAGNVVVFLHPKALRDLMIAEAADYFTKDFALTQRDVAVLERRWGVDFIVTNKVKAQDNTTNDTYRNLMAIRGHTLGLASAADLQVEAQRRPDLSAVKVGMRHRVVGSVFDATSLVRISTAQ